MHVAFYNYCFWYFSYVTNLNRSFLRPSFQTLAVFKGFSWAISLCQSHQNSVPTSVRNFLINPLFAKPFISTSHSFFIGIALNSPKSLKYLTYWNRFLHLYYIMSILSGIIVVGEARCRYFQLYFVLITKYSLWQLHLFF